MPADQRPDGPSRLTRGAHSGPEFASRLTRGAHSAPDCASRLTRGTSAASDCASRLTRGTSSASKCASWMGAAFLTSAARQTMFQYLHDQETGLAAWDEHGVLLYAHGTVEQSARTP